MTPTTDLPCCENCPNRYKQECSYYAWIEFGNCGISCDSYFEFTSLVGCLSHPGARAYLNKSAIAELEQRVKNANSVGGYPMMAVYEAIALLRGDGK
jgi:hypothetical protein